MANTSTTAVVLAALRKRYIRTFKQQKALSPETAINPHLYGIKRTLVFKSLVRKGIVKSVAEDLFYLDAVKEIIFQKKTHKAAVIVLALMVIVISLVLIFVFPKVSR